MTKALVHAYRRWLTFLFVGLLAAPIAIPMIAIAQGAPNPPPADFGSPPSGEIPILYNDHHVYSKPDTLKNGRVLAALVRGGTILIPLRSMFEQMGASVSYDPASKTADVSKPGSDVKVTVGKPEVIINGESRPLDVPPEMYKGTVLVPIRVISEGMGAYVQWVPDKRLVVVRYLPPTPPPPPATATPPPATPPPTPTPSPTPKPIPRQLWVNGDWIYAGKIYNEFSAGNKLQDSYNVQGGGAIPLGKNLAVMAEGDFREWEYTHTQNIATPAALPNGVIPCPPGGDPGCVTVIGGGGQVFVPSFKAKESDTDARIGIGFNNPKIFVVGSWLFRTNNFGYPKTNGPGFGIEVLPDFRQEVTLYGSWFYYPWVHGDFLAPSGQSFTTAYNINRYQFGGMWVIAHSPVYLDIGYMGDHGIAKADSPIGFLHQGGYVGLGIHF